jgi:hypothetical protein
MTICRLLNFNSETDIAAAEESMDYLEEFVMQNLFARYPFELVIAPQFKIQSEMSQDKAWSEPDFLVLHLRSNQIWIVEVSSAANVDDLSDKVKTREKQFYQGANQRKEP